MAKKYRLVKKIGKLKKGSMLQLKGVMYVSGTTSFDAFSVWKNKTYFEKVK